MGAYLAYTERSWEVFRTVSGAGTCEGECRGRRRMLAVRTRQQWYRLWWRRVFSPWVGQGVEAGSLSASWWFEDRTRIRNCLCLEFYPQASSAGALPIIGTEQHRSNRSFLWEQLLHVSWVSGAVPPLGCDSEQGPALAPGRGRQTKTGKQKIIPNPGTTGTK